MPKRKIKPKNIRILIAVRNRKRRIERGIKYLFKPHFAKISTTFEIEIRVAQLSLLILNLVEINFSIWAKKKNQAKNSKENNRKRNQKNYK